MSALWQSKYRREADAVLAVLAGRDDVILDDAEALDREPRPLLEECEAPWIAAVREIAQTEPVVDSDFGYEHCVFCGGDDTDSPMGRVAHDPDCAWLRLNKAFPPEAEVLPAAADKEADA
jgi:hypothetical protein